MSDRNRRTALYSSAFALGMLGMGLLRCRFTTCFAGHRVWWDYPAGDLAEANTVEVGTQTMSVRFDGNTDPNLPWKFAPMQVTQKMPIGTRKLAFYRAENLSDKPVTGVASFNVQPELAGLYFKKIHCFCFEQQTLQPGQSVEMPVQYYVDPAILKDPETAGIKQITLSYTFHVSADQQPAGKVASKALDPLPSAR
jgi:cytochrome c oxidase assembly protein subunit 11